MSDPFMGATPSFVQPEQKSNIPKVIPFSFEGANFRALEIDGEPYFVGRDVAELLGYAKPENAIATHCKGTLKRGIPTPGGEQQMGVIPERDLYRLIMRSKLPAAERFEERVVGEVLPTIRKTGSYGVAAVQPTKKPSRPRLTGPVLRELTGFPERLRAEFPSMSEADRLAAFNRFSASLLGEPLLPERQPDVFPIDAEVLPALPAPSHPEFVSASEIGVIIGVRLGMPKLSGAAVNKLLSQQGFQMPGPTKTTKWVPTAKGEPFAHWETAEKAGERGGTANWLRWRYGIVDELVAAMTAGQGEG